MIDSELPNTIKRVVSFVTSFKRLKNQGDLERNKISLFRKGLFVWSWVS